MVNSFAIGLLRKVLQQQSAYYCYKNSCFVGKTSWISLSTLLLCSKLHWHSTIDSRIWNCAQRDCNNKKNEIFCYSFNHFVCCMFIVLTRTCIQLSMRFFFQIFFEPASIVNFKILSLKKVNAKKKVTKNVETSTPSLFDLKRRFDAKNVYVAFSKKIQKEGAKKILSTYLKIQTPNFKRIQFKHPPNSYYFLNSRTPSFNNACFMHFTILYRLCASRFFVTPIYIMFQIFCLEKWKWVQLYQYPSFRYFLQMHQRRIIIYIYSFVSSTWYFNI